MFGEIVRRLAPPTLQPTLAGLQLQAVALPGLPESYRTQGKW